jgi:hypothetical protein
VREESRAAPVIESPWLLLSNRDGDVLRSLKRNGDAQAEGGRSIIGARGRLVHDGRWGRDIDRPRRIVDHRRGRIIIDIALDVVSVALVVIIAAAVPTVMVLPAICHGRAQGRGPTEQRSDADCRRQDSPAAEKSTLGRHALTSESGVHA